MTTSDALSYFTTVKKIIDLGGRMNGHDKYVLIKLEASLAKLAGIKRPSRQSNNNRRDEKAAAIRAAEML